MDYTITASRRQFLPALSRQAAITSDSIIPRQILIAEREAAGTDRPGWPLIILKGRPAAGEQP